MSSKTKSTAEKEGKPALVPKLRFPEFRKAQGGWKKIPIGEKVDLLSGYPFDGPDITQNSSGIRLLRGINITEGRIRHSQEIDRYYTGAVEALEKFRVHLNDLVIGMDGSKVGKNSALITKEDEDALLIQRVARLRASNPALIQFIFQQINSTTFHTYVDKINTSSGIPHISAKQIKDFTICFPSPAEQQKIAECLSSLDELITAQARKLDALKTHKKGLMQQLFPREGETQPRLRFPEFQNAADWKEKRLEDLAKRGSGHTPSKSYPEYYNGGIKWVSLADSKRLDCGLISDTAIKISEQGIENSSAVLHPAGTVLISRDAGIGKSAVMSLPMAVSQHFIAWTCNARLLSNWFLYHLLQNSKPRFERAATGSTIKTIGLQFFIDLVFLIPSLPEQQRIADCLSSLDALITAETENLEALKTHKEGLMQQLFPSLEELES